MTALEMAELLSIKKERQDVLSRVIYYLDDYDWRDEKETLSRMESELKTEIDKYETMLNAVRL